MHELSLCRSIEGIVNRAAGDRRVKTVTLDVGALRQVVPDTLTYCWGVVTEQTKLAGSLLAINHLPVVLECTECGATTRLDHVGYLTCANCGSWKVRVVSGEEFLVRSIDVEG